MKTQTDYKEQMPMSQGTYVCPACQRFFKTKEELEEHARLAHPQA